MSRWPVVASVACITVLLSVAFANGQMAGSRAGQQMGAHVAELPELKPDVAQGYITIEGRATLRVRPTEIRIVMAVTAEGPSAQECQKTVDAAVQKLTVAWEKMGIKREKMVVDFIAILPRYEWEIEKRGNLDVGIEKRAGYRMQTNVHLAVGDDAEAQAALGRAFEQGITDIIAFDYWSKELDEARAKARQQALEAARRKADALLDGLFEAPPPAINVQERTVVYYPESLYHSFDNSYEEAVTPSTRRDIPMIHAYRPQNTYYRGLVGDADVQPPELPMRPEISVVSTVRLYYQSPAAEATKDREAADRKVRKRRR